MDFANNPSFIRQGLSPGTRLAICVALSVALLIGDSQYGLMEYTRQGMSVLFYPLQRAINFPLVAARRIDDFLTTQSTLQAENEVLRRQQMVLLARVQRLESAEHDFESLRTLNQLKSVRSDSASLAEILYTGRDPFSYKIIIDKGQDTQLHAGQPVVDDRGLIGQITRVQPLTAEVTLITDKTLMVPVMIQRTGLRAILYGYGGGVEARYLPIHADVRPGDLMVTSGIDGLYPEGVPVAFVTRVERNPDSAFIRVTSMPTAGVQKGRYVLVLKEKTSVPARPVDPAAPPPKKGKTPSDDPTE
ncbi:MAG: rod shape-determining protein MreC [Paludibacterium sp.]|uniref:rod shape-determining protein MreC n=1 Tax=Paludibacterium sp. TaxID=1917523 RepID=UPI0025F9AB70|nr:rod shape-determining protein MreC [Paludibacterium sp.]MBV8048323.1 rod shape-determining protein MreC [Paludibacterium sp.]MBV8649372.1 rod shape-determining protein MreC [Paludibacterium sp.]